MSPGGPLRDRFIALWNRTTGLDGAATFARLDAGYGAPERRYHDWAHVAAMLAGLDAWAPGAALPAESLDDIALAVFFHDAVYDATRNDNEARSAALLAEEARDGWLLGERLERIGRMIEATAAHALSADPATQALLDLDLAILAAEPAAYGAYAAAIRREYAHVPEPLWRAGRAAVLERFLARERIYGSPAFAALEAAARANLSAEREALLSRTEA